MPDASTSEMADELRTQARDHPTVATVTAQLPSLPESGATDEGLYVETEDTPGIVVNGELRVSLVRIMSVGPEGPRLVGQVQAVQEVDNPLTTWSLRLFTHEPEFFSTEQHDEPQPWFVRVQALHYETTDAELQLETELVEA